MRVRQKRERDPQSRVVRTLHTSEQALGREFQTWQTTLHQREACVTSCGLPALEHEGHTPRKGLLSQPIFGVGVALKAVLSECITVGHAPDKPLEEGIEKTSGQRVWHSPRRSLTSSFGARYLIKQLLGSIQRH